MRFETFAFTDLSIHQLFQIYRLRSEVFVVEQNCVYQDIDDVDMASYHVLGYVGEEIQGYSRLLPPGTLYSSAAIGRVVIRKAHRNNGYGGDLMKYCISKTMELFGNKEIVISAQCYLRDFYSGLGFSAEGEPYDEDGIPHIRMRLFMKGAS